MGRKQWTVVIVNDHQLLTDLLKPVLIRERFGEIHSFVDAKSAVEFVIADPPALFLIDMMLPIQRTLKGKRVDHHHPYVLMDCQTAIRTVQKIRSKCPETKIIILSGERHPHTFLLGFEAGAHAVISKLDDLDSFRQILKRVTNGEMGITSERMQKVLNKYKKLPRAVLSPLEVKILELTQEGMESPQIGHKLGYAPKTIRNTLSIINEKLGTSNRLEALEMAIEIGLVGWRMGDYGG